ncbi:LLM class flavin-dependent oxidoreductase [Fodinicola feengrottensis]|uniref:LLM class flavin-dependent oxidoreductase n=1 Tax=Fodinicola feengrottensis TaxID=435914 RepID=UPI0024426104|nr:LLM class flavin-dependent oxidoreductase [Fodinicola feengrottensis]
MTAPMQVDYQDILRVWQEADGIAEIEHAWLFDHLMPIGGDPDGPIYEGWTLLSALAAQTQRLRLGLLVSSNRFRPPAMLAKMATTTVWTSCPADDSTSASAPAPGPVTRWRGASTKGMGSRSMTSRTPWRALPRPVR